MPQKKSVSARVFDFLSGYGVAVTCLLLLLVLTWLSTLEQPEKGLYEVQKRYYDAEAWFVMPDIRGMPEINGKRLGFPLPGAYLVTTVLFVNLFLGGLVRIRKGWKYAGVIIAHFSMISLLVAGFVSHHYSREGIMSVYEGEESDFAQSYYDYTLEVSEIVGGLRTAPYVVAAKNLSSLDIEDVKRVEFPDLPFDIDVSHWMRNSEVQRVQGSSVSKLPTSNGHTLSWLENAPLEEENAAGCFVHVLPKDGAPSPEKLLMFGRHVDASTATVEGRIFAFSLIREIWPMPFRVRLDSSVGEYYPGTSRPSSFQSEITRFGDKADDAAKSFTIKMNEPMRYDGYTLYQARWQAESDRAMSGFAIVKNPSDQWPKYSIYMSILGLTIHFGVKLFSFIGQSNRKRLKGQVSKS